MTKRILDATRFDVYSHNVKFESVSESPVRHAATFDYEHRYAEHEREHEKAIEGGFGVVCNSPLRKFYPFDAVITLTKH